MSYNREDTSTHVICLRPSCTTYMRFSAEDAHDFFADSGICPPDLLKDMEKTGINIMFDEGCPRCRPDTQFSITTTDPRCRMH